jgi:cytochrome c biogenesis protein CcmG, thiol:disulfide interchange protein DsbE
VPCRDEFPLFEEQLKTLGPTDGLQILGVLYKDDATSAQKFVTDQGATWPSVQDDANGSIAKAYRTVAPPQTYFIDKDGILRGIQIGQVLPEDFASQYAKIKP